jgi:hypothetical protein
LVYPAGSRACVREYGRGEGGLQTGDAVVIEDGPNAGASYCLGVQASWPSLYATGGSQASKLEIIGVTEADAPGLLAELNDPIAAVVVVEGGVSSPIYNKIPGTCLLRLPPIPYVSGPHSEAIYDPSGIICG